MYIYIYIYVYIDVYRCIYLHIYIHIHIFHLLLLLTSFLHISISTAIDILFNSTENTGNIAVIDIFGFRVLRFTRALIKPQCHTKIAYILFFV